jgi:hypothetical protein
LKHSDSAQHSGYQSVHDLPLVIKEF